MTIEPLLRVPARAPVSVPTRQRRKEARPQELLDAALDLFVEKGFAATRSEEVALRAGVSKGTLYLYYPSKEDLLKEVIRHNVVNQIAEGADLIRQFDGGTPELLAKVLRLWWMRVGETRASGILKLMMSEARNFPEIAQFYVDEVIKPSHAMFGALVQRGIDRGEFRAVNVDDVVHVLITPLLFLVMNKHSLGACSVGSRLEAAPIIDAQIDLVLHGLESSHRSDEVPADARQARPDAKARPRNRS
ncbi:MAG: TetR/AcrR family transcriptional regulator [Caldimonas sp.]